MEVILSGGGGDFVVLHYFNGINGDDEGLFPRSQVARNILCINKWKVMTTHLVNCGHKFPKHILLPVKVLPPNHVCTRTYLIVGCFDTREEAENLCTYLKTRFVQFLVYALASTQNLCKEKFRLVPVQDFTQRWTDEMLYQKYNLTEEEIALIESEILPKD